MRFLKVLILILLFFASMLFFVQNTQALSMTIALELDLFVQAWRSIPLPLYFLLLFSFVLGALITLGYCIAERLRMGAALRRARKQINDLEQEVTSLRTLPLEEHKQAMAVDRGTEEG